MMKHRMQLESKSMKRDWFDHSLHYGSKTVRHVS